MTQRSNGESSERGDLKSAADALLIRVSGRDSDRGDAQSTGDFQLVHSHADLRERLMEDSSQSAVIIYQAPNHWVCARDAQTAPEAALVEWRTWAQSVLGIVRQYRHRVRVIDPVMITLDPESLESQTGVPLSVLESFVKGVDVVAPPVLLLAASALVLRDAEVDGLQRELEASVVRHGSQRTDRSNAATLFVEAEEQVRQLEEVEIVCERLFAERASLLESFKSNPQALFSSAADGADETVDDKEDGVCLEPGLKQSELSSALAATEKQLSMLVEKCEQQAAALKAAQDIESVCERLAEEKNNLVRRVEALEAELAEKTNELASRERFIGDALSRADGLGEQVEVLSAHRDDLANRLVYAERWIDLTQRSWSYRVMQPVRKLHAALRKPQSAGGEGASN